MPAKITFLTSFFPWEHLRRESGVYVVFQVTVVASSHPSYEYHLGISLALTAGPMQRVSPGASSVNHNASSSCGPQDPAHP
jgi:hypothetical protein